MKTKWLYSLLILGLLATTACNNQEPATEAVAEVKKVELVTVKEEQAVKVTELSGTLQPLEEALVSFEVGGRITELAKNEGDTVRAGDVLARLDSNDYSLQVAAASATVQQTGATLSKVNNGAREQEVTQARLLVDKATIAYEKAQDDFKRIERLYQEKAISQSEYENAQNYLNVTQKDLQNAQQALSLVTQGAREEDKELSRATYNQAVISKELAASTLAKTQLRSPLDGTIIAKLTSEGSLVGVGSPVYRVGEISTLKVVLPVPDREIFAWKEGETVSLDLYGQMREGKVVKIYPATNQSTGTIGVEVQVANEKHDWFAGQVVKATKTVTGKAGLYIPVEAVLSRGQGEAHVFLNNGGKAVKTPVTIGEINSNKLEITSGIKEGDQLVVKGVDRLFDGDPIEAAGGQPQ
ncbi:efflux RND transporter periplasmic adaptor subunit [Brevibacillus ruminantium]|uniref:Efflux RND transporter periplasmic adaptor subunit n=1 Tax=Brevibacillus ruminantium TaxID=2950604 RepID=A0ABY4WE86_9BACL|nr:efflux RND transporter periplasmic adaptor subunit [Brevibacillus ruminantium]USG65481.1 efflux RND transporter periplasmic adaptor subunit [Brevibacillus ruminantium]